MKRILTIAFDFPPRRTSGVFRIVQMTKRLPSLGWLPTVLTVGEQQGDVVDASLLSDIPPEVSVQRTNYYHVAGWENRVAENVKAAGGLRSEPKQRAERPIDRWLRWLADTFRNIAYFPDDTVGWVPPGLATAIELHMQRPFDLVYTTSPPRAGLVIGLMMKKLFGVPWVAEFRDPWYSARRPLRQSAERWLQSRVLHKADAVVVVTEGNARDFTSKFGLPSDKVTVVRNGFDKRDFTVRSDQRNSLFVPGFIHLSHFGTIYQGLSGKFFQAIKELAEESPESARLLRINIIGFPDEVASQYAAERELQDIIKLYGFMKHEEAVEAMRWSDYLLLFLAHHDFSRLAVPGKLYEYLPSGRPILAVTYEGETKQIIEKYKAGLVVDPDDTQDIKKALRQLIANNGTGPNLLRPSEAELAEEFSYDRLAERLTKVFDSVSSHGK